MGISQAMILAAGRGARMRPLTDTTPKPLLEVQGKPLIVHHIEKCVAAGIRDIVINHAWLGEKIEAVLGDGSQFGAKVTYSPEEKALETAGGIIQALPQLSAHAFLVISADVWTDMDITTLQLSEHALAHLALVQNPSHHRGGDFGLNQAGYVCNPHAQAYTYSGIGVFHPDLFSSYPAGHLPLRTVLEEAIAKQQVTGHVHSGMWSDVGTPERLAALQT